MTFDMFIKITIAGCQLALVNYDCPFQTSGQVESFKRRLPIGARQRIHHLFQHCTEVL